MEKCLISTRSSKKGYLYVKKEDLSAPAPISVNKTGIKRISNCIDSTDTDYEKTPPHNSHLGSYEHKGEKTRKVYTVSAKCGNGSKRI